MSETDIEKLRDVMRKAIDEEKAKREGCKK